MRCDLYIIISYVNNNLLIITAQSMEESSAFCTGDTGSETCIIKREDLYEKTLYG